MKEANHPTRKKKVNIAIQVWWLPPSPFTHGVRASSHDFGTLTPRGMEEELEPRVSSTGKGDL
jgi:hypothetical protein